MTNAHGIPDETEVVIVGGGPVGMTLALTLERAGARYVVFDEKPGPRPHSKACVLWPRVLEIFDLLGVVDKWYAQPVPLQRFVVAIDRNVRELSLGAAKSPHPNGLLVGQDVTERFLDEALRERAAPLFRNTTVRGVVNGENQATVSYDSGGTAAEVRRRFVVGCDGSNSVVREAAGIEREGDRNAGVQLVQGDVKIAGSLALDPNGGFVWSELPDVDLFVLPVDANGHYRILAIVPDNERRGDPTLEELQSLCRRYVVISGHVHNYQRFTVIEVDNRQIPFVVSGNGGYTRLGRLRTIDGQPPSQPLKLTDTLSLESYDDVRFGFVRFEVTKDTIVGKSYVAVFEPSAVPQTTVSDTFTIDIAKRTVTTS